MFVLFVRNVVNTNIKSLSHILHTFLLRESGVGFRWNMIILKIERRCSFTDEIKNWVKKLLMFFISSVKLHHLSIFNIIMFHLKPTPLSLSKIVNVHEKSSFLLLFFEISKWAETTIFWLKKIGQNHDNSVYKKALKSEHQKKLYFSR